MKVLLATSPHLSHPKLLSRLDGTDEAVMLTFCPVGLLSLLAVAATIEGVHGQFYDTNAFINRCRLETDGAVHDRVAADIVATDPDIVGFMTDCDSFHHVLSIVKRIKARKPGTTIVLGGPHASAVGHDVLERYDDIDYVFHGEAELSFKAFLQDRMAGRPDAHLGFSSRRGGIVTRHQLAPLVDSLDELPVPLFELYSPAPGEEIFLEVGRGCPYACSFCSTAPFWRRKHRVKSPARIHAEMHLLKRRFRTTRVHFTHDLFTADTKWVRELCRYLQDHALDMAWTCSARTDTVDETLLEEMALAGCSAIYFGLESGSERVMEKVRKRIPVEQSLGVVRQCRNAGIRANVGFIVGLPEDDVASVDATFDAFGQCIEAGARPAHIFGFCPFRGSSGFSSISDPVHDGHYLDLPLPAEQQAAMREMIGGSFEIFGSFWRVRPPGVHARWLDGLQGIDEFSPLVETARIPSILLAKKLGGMGNLYREWVSHLHGEPVKPAPRYYGSPGQFLGFLQGLCVREGEVAAGDCVRVLTLLAKHVRRSPKSIEAYRSYPLAESAYVNCEVRRTEILGSVRIHHDISRWLEAEAWEPGSTLPAAAHTAHVFRTEAGDILCAVISQPVGTVLRLLGDKYVPYGDFLAATSQLAPPERDEATASQWAEEAIGLLAKSKLIHTHAR